MADPNEKYRIAEFKVNETDVMRVYILNPGDVFVRFGGSSAGLLVKKTASLITSVCGPAGVYDTEYDVNSPSVWNRIFQAAHLSKSL